MATTIKPLHDRVIIRRIDEASDKTAGGLYHSRHGEGKTAGRRSYRRRRRQI